MISGSEGLKGLMTCRSHVSGDARGEGERETGEGGKAVFDNRDLAICSCSKCKLFVVMSNETQGK